MSQMLPNSDLAIKNLQLRIADKILCHSLNMRIEAGTCVGILGSNGSGKTTLLHTLAGLVSAAQGDIYWHQKKISQWRPKHWAQYVGIVFQEFEPAFPQSLLQYCMAARYPHRRLFQTQPIEEDTKLAQASLEKMGLAQLQHACISTLSGGEKKRLMLAALFTQAPHIYLLDEPMNHLDIHYQIKTLKQLTTLARTQQASIIMSMHDINLAAHFCDQLICFFPDGSTQHGPTTQLVNEATLAALYPHPLKKIDWADKSFWLPAY